jgi:hypothetical protein
MLTWKQWLWELLPDKCEQQDCLRLGVRGNEQIVGGMILCDTCAVKVRKETPHAEGGPLGHAAQVRAVEMGVSLEPEPVEREDPFTVVLHFKPVLDGLPDENFECVLLFPDQGGLTSQSVYGPILWSKKNKAWLDLFSSSDSGTIVYPKQVAAWAKWEKP